MLANALGDRAGRVMLLIITTVISVAALRYAEAILAPLVFGLVLAIVVSPIVEKLVRVGLPKFLSVTAALILTSMVVVFLFVAFAPLVTLMIERFPRLKAAAEGWIATLSEMLRGIETISEEIEKTVGAEAVEQPANIPTVTDALWLAPNLGAQVFIFIGTFFFFLLTRDEIYGAAGGLKDRLYRADAVVSRYFAAVTLVNIGVGVATAAALMVIGVEYALLWGFAAGVLNYILYLGPLVITAGLLVAGMVQFWGAMAFVPPFAFLVINFIEANFVTPLVVGQHVKANPLVVFLAIVFGLWLWGPVGAIVALPVILWIWLMLTPEAKSLLQQADGSPFSPPPS